jgi:predicted ABC-type ATPase
LGLLGEAIRNTDRAYLFDTSDKDPWYIAEVTDGTNIDMKSDEMPNWFQSFWDRF